MDLCAVSCASALTSTCKNLENAGGHGKCGRCSACCTELASARRPIGKMDGIEMRNTAATMEEVGTSPLLELSIQHEDPLKVVCCSH
eukprot:4055948-Prymnesium_polylepis.1